MNSPQPESFGRQCSEKISEAESMFQAGKVEESRQLMSVIRGSIEAHLDMPQMMSDWSPQEVKDLNQAWTKLWESRARIDKSWGQRPPQWK